MAPAVAAWLAALVLLGCPATAGAAIAVAAGLAALVVRRRLGSAPATTVVTAALVAVAGTAAVTAVKVYGVTAGPVPGLAARGAVVTAEAVVTDDPKIRPHRGGAARADTAVVPARMVAVTTGQARLTVDVPVLLLGSGDGWADLLPSERIRVSGRLAEGDPGELLAAVMFVRGPPGRLSGPSPAQRVAGILRAGLRAACDVLPPDQRGLLPGLVVGDVSRMDRDLARDFTTAGLSHLTAVSGTNLSVVAAAALVLARLTGLSLRLRAIVMIAAMVAFAVVARPSPSVLRALVMGTVAALALGTGRSRDGLAALAAAVLGLLLFDPGLARQYGFALSVFATGGILLLAPRWRDRLARRMPRLLAEALAVPAAAQIAVTPLLLTMSGRLDLVAIPANLLAEPAVAPATVLGFIAAVVAPVSSALAQMIVRPAGLAVGWIIGVAERAAGLPFAAVAWPGGAAGIALLAGTAAVTWMVLRTRGGRRVAGALAIGALVAFLVTSRVAAPWPPPGWVLVACDVGQGDALAMAAGPGRAVVVDAGPEPGPTDRCLRDLGVRQVPLVVLTHPHLDHVGGLTGVLRGRTAGAVVVSPERVPLDEAARVSRELRARGVPEWVTPPGASWRFGPLELTVLAPPVDARPEGGSEGAMANNGSVVLLARWLSGDGRLLGSVLLAGDLENEAQADLLRRGVPQVDVLKVPHHGSSRQDPAFLAATHARAALISVGAVNDYGHPAPLTLRRLAWLGMRAYRTDQSGDLAVVSAGGHLAVVPRGVSAGVSGRVSGRVSGHVSGRVSAGVSSGAPRATPREVSRTARPP
ncbi:ComEC/Rec2 family competence protein [Microbispora sp. RL4-1S]|uniref:ComEC/Rec2 family competence protein n=1 Tax=Microbispora oryzae TaxID=2806554 RepID=A0A941AG74_9ACTN|nr:ComEC/Rec2 family competence protein [Microbispora oryzae]